MHINSLPTTTMSTTIAEKIARIAASIEDAKKECAAAEERQKEIEEVSKFFCLSFVRPS